MKVRTEKDALVAEIEDALEAVGYDDAPIGSIAATVTEAILENVRMVLSALDEAGVLQ